MGGGAVVPPVEAPRPSITAPPKRVDAKFPALHAPADVRPDEFLSLNMFYGSASSPSRSGGNERFETRTFRGIVTEMALDIARLASSTFDEKREEGLETGGRFGEF